MWDWLFGSSVPEGDREIYQSRLTRGRTALSVLVDDAPSIAVSTVEDILDRYDPVDLRVENEGAGISAASLDSGAVDYSDRGRERERVIPLPEEQLKVGKRATEQVRRVKTYVVEEPVEQDVTLHDERVTIERRPAETAAAGEPAEREYEIREHHEEPMVEKRMRAGEELVVRREADDRTERVSDTIRKTKADIDKRS
jgi:stress response protein YsnF